MRRLLGWGVAVTIGLAVGPNGLGAQGGFRWKAHDPDRPKPRQIEPGRVVGEPPADAVVLFGGTDLGGWVSSDGSAPKWAVRDGYMETVPGAGPIRTTRGFGDAQLHVEWAAPAEPVGTGQNRGNSGVYLMGLYEVQVLDSYRNTTYADGQAAALYGQHPPLVNASRGPGEWQSYDIVFRRPRFAPNGRLLKSGRMTVFHNGVLVQDAAELWGPTNWLEHGTYVNHAAALPLSLQDHAHPVRYRNLWIRPLPDPPADERGLARSKPALIVPGRVLDRYVGRYGSGNRVEAAVSRAGSRLVLTVFGRSFVLVPATASRFLLPRTAGTVEFTEAGDGVRVKVEVAETVVEAPKIK
jgi:hypothetical protein